MEKLRMAAIIVGTAICMTHCVGPARASTTSDALELACPGKGHLAGQVELAARRHLVHHVVLVSLVAAESGCRPEATNRKTGARGLGQILPGGSADRPGANLYDPDVNLDLTARHLASLLVLCGNLGGAVHVYHGHRTCRGWRKDPHAVKVVAWVESFWNEMRRKKERVT